MSGRESRLGRLCFVFKLYLLRYGYAGRSVHMQIPDTSDAYGVGSWSFTSIWDGNDLLVPAFEMYCFLGIDRPRTMYPTRSPLKLSLNKFWRGPSKATCSGI